ncbi:MAG TPA: orotidine-5'-phosphate decarboxylase [Clostridiales bacterium]|nr:orotidine-5'-phosphate decarboxylase [Clostridiales bacterium]
MFIEKLHLRIEKCKNPVCAGLDPRIGYVPEFLRRNESESNAILRYNRMLIDALMDCVPLVKLQMACYECYGTEGMELFIKTAEYAAEKGLVVIADGKRNDIGSTAEEYARAYLGSGSNPLDALTVNPYLGEDGILPFVESCRINGKGIFVLVRTSNPSSSQLQELVLANGRMVYEKVAELVENWANLPGMRREDKGYSCVGAVVGATWPEQAMKLRQIMPSALFLVPGYGSQGGTADGAAACFDNQGRGAVVNASRSILCAWQSPKWKAKYSPDQFDEAARAEALSMAADLRGAIDARSHEIKWKGVRHEGSPDA